MHYVYCAISLRESMERPEAQDAGTIILSGLDEQYVINSIKAVVNEFNDDNYQYNNIAPDYKIPNTSHIVMKLILGNTKLSAKWAGIKKK